VTCLNSIHIPRIPTLTPTSIDTLVQQAQGFLSANKSKITRKILPDTKRWFEALQPLLGLEPNPTLSMISSVGSVISLVQTTSNRNILRPDRDINGYSIALRMALYTSKLVSGVEDLNTLDLGDQVEILWLLILTQLLASDQIGLEEDNKLWSSLTHPDAESQIQDFVVSSYTQSVATANNASTWRSISPEGHQNVAQKLVAKLIEASRGSSLLAFYAAHALSNLISTLVETHGWKSSGGDEWLSSQDILKTSTSSAFTSVGVLFGLQEVLGSSKLVNNLSNRLVSDITGASPKQEKTLSSLILLNATLAVYEPGNLPVAQNRLVFAVKQIISWMAEEERISLPLAAEACKCLQILLFSIKDVYGPYWQATLDFCIDLWKPAKGNLDERLPALQASLRLVNILKGLQEPNDDLVEALSDSSETISQGLLSLLRLPRTKGNQPWRIFDELLFRKVMEIPLKHIKDPSEIYPSVASECHFIQLAAFHTLNRAIPAAQEQISVDVLLEKNGKKSPA
jgi:E3 ubiquitin-protein ligase listerin